MKGHISKRMQTILNNEIALAQVQLALVDRSLNKNGFVEIDIMIDRQSPIIVPDKQLAICDCIIKFVKALIW